MARDGPLTTSSTWLGRVLAFWAGMALIAAASRAHGEPSLPALNSYGQPPFVPVGAERPVGLAKTFVELLNKAMGGRQEVHLDNLPRRRLEVMLGDRSFACVFRAIADTVPL